LPLLATAVRWEGPTRAVSEYTPEVKLERTKNSFLEE